MAQVQAPLGYGGAGQAPFVIEHYSPRAISHSPQYHSPVLEGVEPELAPEFAAAPPVPVQPPAKEEPPVPEKRWPTGATRIDRLLVYAGRAVKRGRERVLMHQCYTRWRVWVERALMLRPHARCCREVQARVPVEELKQGIALHTRRADAHTMCAKHYSDCAAQLCEVLRGRLHAEMNDLEQHVLSRSPAAAQGGGAFTPSPTADGNPHPHPGEQPPSSSSSLAAASPCPIPQLPSYCGAESDEFTLPFSGYISRGGDLGRGPRWLRLEDAQRVARADPECLGFTYNTERAAVDGRVKVYFKRKCEIQGAGRGQWCSYLRFNAQIAGGAGEEHGSLLETTFAEVPKTATRDAGANARTPVALPPPAPQQSQQPLTYARPVRTPTPIAAVTPVSVTPSPEGDAPGNDAGSGDEGEPSTHLRRRGLCPRTRRRLMRFYTHHNPAKLPSVTPTLVEFRGHERELFAALIVQYGPEPRGPDPPLADGWYAVESTNGDLFYKHADGIKQWRRPVVAAV